MESIPQELNWVVAHTSCTVARVFRELFEGVKRDVEAVNLACKLGPDSCFIVDPADADKFMIRRGESIEQVVTFRFGGDAISVKDEAAKNKFTIKLTVSASGRCKLRVGQAERAGQLEKFGPELEQWQVRKMALEGLFFGLSWVHEAPA
jgi:hypothetical protein